MKGPSCGFRMPCFRKVFEAPADEELASLLGFGAILVITGCVRSREAEKEQEPWPWERAGWVPRGWDARGVRETGLHLSNAAAPSSARAAARRTANYGSKGSCVLM